MFGVCGSGDAVVRCCRWDELHLSDAANRQLAQRIFDGHGGYTTPGSLAEALGVAKLGPVDEQGQPLRLPPLVGITVLLCEKLEGCNILSVVF